MAKKDMASGMKSAYDLALERLERDGIDKPRDDSLRRDTRESMAEARSKAKAKLAELEILHRDRLQRLADPAKIAEEEEEYRKECRRIEENRDRQLEKLRQEG